MSSTRPEVKLDVGSANSIRENIAKKEKEQADLLLTEFSATVQYAYETMSNKGVGSWKQELELYDIRESTIKKYLDTDETTIPSEILAFVNKAKAMGFELNYWVDNDDRIDDDDEDEEEDPDREHGIRAFIELSLIK